MGTPLTDIMREASRPPEPARPQRPGRSEVPFALAAFAVLCIVVLVANPFLVEPDDFAYRASIIGITEGHLLTLSTAQVQALAAHLDRLGGGGIRVGLKVGRSIVRSGPVPSRRIGAGPGPVGPLGIPQWVQLSNGRWISEKDPGYPFLAAPFQALGLIRLAPLFYGALACLGLFVGARRWLGRYGGTAAVALFCSSGAAMLFAWRDYMPTFTDASLIAAGSGALLWVLLANDASRGRRTGVGLLAFLALEAAVFVRYTDIVVLGCAVLTVVVVWRFSRSTVSTGALAWWLGSVVLFGAAVALFDDLVYGGPFKTGYGPGEIEFAFSSILPNFRYMPAHLIEAMPMLFLGIGAVAWIAWRRVRFRARLASGELAASARRDFVVALALAASWFGVWGLYSAYTWTANPYGTTLQFARFYVPALGAISLLGAYPIVRLTRAARPARFAAVAIVAALFALGAWSYDAMRAHGAPINKGPTITKSAAPHASRPA